MNELETRFRDVQAKLPTHGDVLILSHACGGLRYSKDIITKVFNKCVGDDQYEPSEKTEIIEYLHRFSMSDTTPYKI